MFDTVLVEPVTTTTVVVDITGTVVYVVGGAVTVVVFVEPAVTTTVVVDITGTVVYTVWVAVTVAVGVDVMVCHHQVMVGKDGNVTVEAAAGGAAADPLEITPATASTRINAETANFINNLAPPTDQLFSCLPYITLYNLTWLQRPAANFHKQNNRIIQEADLRR